MMFVETWGDVLTRSVQSIWFGVIGFVPNLIIALIIFAIGWIFAVLVEKVIEGVFKSIKVDSLLRSAGVEDVVRRAGYTLNAGRFVGSLVKWFIIVVFLVAAFDAIGLSQVNEFLSIVVLGYLPRVIVAVLILMVSVIVASTMQKIVVSSAQAAHIHSAGFLGKVTKWSIWIFALLTALSQLGIAAGFLQILFTGIVVAISLALGLAFGLGGRDTAAEILTAVKRDLSNRN